MQKYQYCRLPRPQAPIKSVYYWGWSNDDDVSTLNAILNAKTALGKPQITNLHVFMNFPKILSPIDENDPVKALTTCPTVGQIDGIPNFNPRYVECNAKACKQLVLNNPDIDPKMCDVYGTMDDQLTAPVDPNDLSKGIKVNVYGAILQQMRQRGISIILSMVGGHGQFGPRTKMSPEGTKKLAQYFIDFLQKQDWDGIDFDDEYYISQIESPLYMVNLYKALYEIGHPLGYSFSLPVTYNMYDLFPTITPYVDYVMDMSYTGSPNFPPEADLAVSKHVFGIGVSHSNALNQAQNYATACKPGSSTRTDLPQGILTFGGPWSAAAPIVNKVATKLFLS
jgi:hypothetical protein